MSTRYDYDGDARRKGMVEDGMPPRGLFRSAPAAAFRSDADVERDLLALRRRAIRLASVLQTLTAEDPPTIPEGEEGLLMAFILALEDRIARAANARGCHRYTRRDPGLPISCPTCARPIDRAAEACFV